MKFTFDVDKPMKALVVASGRDLEKRVGRLKRGQSKESIQSLLFHDVAKRYAINQYRTHLYSPKILKGS
jgi:hypothetical protein